MDKSVINWMDYQNCKVIARPPMPQAPQDSSKIAQDSSSIDSTNRVQTGPYSCNTMLPAAQSRHWSRPNAIISYKIARGILWNCPRDTLVCFRWTVLWLCYVWNKLYVFFFHFREHQGETQVRSSVGAIPKDYTTFFPLWLGCANASSGHALMWPTTTSGSPLMWEDRLAHGHGGRHHALSHL